MGSRPLRWIDIPRKLVNIFIWKEFSSSHIYNWESKYPISPVYSVDDLMKARLGNTRSYVAAGCWDVRVELSNHFNEFKITHIIYYIIISIMAIADLQ